MAEEAGGRVVKRFTMIIAKKKAAVKRNRLKYQAGKMRLQRQR